MPVDKIPYVSADSASRIPKPVVDVGRAGAHDIRRISGRVIDGLEFDCHTEVKSEAA